MAETAPLDETWSEEIDQPKVDEATQVESELAGIGERFLGVPAVALYLGVAKSTIYAWRSHGTGPVGVMVGGSLRYKLSDIDAWVEEQQAAGELVAAERREAHEAKQATKTAAAAAVQKPIIRNRNRRGVKSPGVV